MSLNFPPSPTVGQIYAGGVNSSTWVWTGSAWVIYSREYGIDWSQLISASGWTPRHITTPQTLPAGEQSVVYDLWIWDNLTVAGSNASYNWGSDIITNEALLNVKKDLNIDGTLTNYGTITFDQPEPHPPHNATYWDYSSGSITTIASAGTWYLLNTSTTAGNIYGDLSVTNNRITNDGTLKRFKINVAVDVESQNNEDIHFRVYKSGSPILESELDTRTFSGGKTAPATLSFIADLDTAEYIEVWIMNATASNDITLHHLNVTIIEITR